MIPHQPTPASPKASTAPQEHSQVITMLFSSPSRIPTTRKISGSRPAAKTPFKIDCKANAARYRILRVSVGIQRQIHRSAMIKFTASLPGNVERTLEYPRHLVRPMNTHEVSSETLASASPDLARVSPVYIREHLATLGHSMFLGASQCKPILGGPLTNEVPVSMASITDEHIPTNVVAVFGQPSRDGKPARVALYPAHGIVLAANCAAFSPFKSGNCDADAMTLPALAFSLPFPELFPIIHKYLYTKEAEFLFEKGFLPGGVPESLVENPRNVFERKKYASNLARNYSTTILLAHAGKVIALWQNMCHLRVVEDEMWDVLEAFWDVLITAIAISTGAEHLL